MADKWSTATKDFKQMMMSFFAQHGLDVDSSGEVNLEQYDLAQSLLHKGICHYLVENFIKSFKSNKFLFKIDFFAKELVSGCGLFLLAKHPDIPGILNLGKMSFISKPEEPGSSGYVLLISSSGQIKIPFNDFWSFKKGFNFSDILKGKLEKFIMKEYELFDSKVKKPKPVTLPLMG